MNERMSFEGEYNRPYHVIELPPLGVGVGTISLEQMRASGELRPEVEAAAVERILSGMDMRPITEADDKCVDGRGVGRKNFPTVGGEFVRKHPVEGTDDNIKPSVAGGGYVTSLAMRAGLGRNSGSSQNDLAAIVDDLAAQGIYSGAHIGEHGHGDKTDCGANDKLAPILAAGVRFKDVIAANTAALAQEAGLEVAAPLLNDVFAHWQAAVEARYGEESTGAERLGVIEDGLRKVQQEVKDDKPVAVVQDLKGSHREFATVVVYSEDVTFSQAAFAEGMAKEFPGEALPDIFVVDVPRLVQLARAQADGDEQIFQQALDGGIAFQLATVAGLTDGSLRTFIVKNS